MVTEGDTIRAIALCGTLLAGLAGFFVFPLRRYYEKHSNQDLFNVLVSYNNAFGGGVILGVGLLHMLADANETLGTYYHYPWAFLLAGVGYGIIYLLEEVMLTKFLFYFKDIISANEMGDIAHTHDSPTSHHHQHHHHRHHHHHHSPEEQPLLLSDTSDEESQTLNGQQQQQQQRFRYKSTTDSAIAIDINEKKNEKMKNNTIRTSLVALALLASLCFHSFFEGMSMGVTANFANVIAILFATISHKAVAAFVLGQSFLRSRLSTSVVISFLLLFAFMTPIGVTVGWGITKYYGDGNANTGSLDKFSGFINAISAGTFIYIGTLIRKDSPDIEHNIDPNVRAGVVSKYVVWWVGFIIMAVAAIWA